MFAAASPEPPLPDPCPVRAGASFGGAVVDDRRLADAERFRERLAAASVRANLVGRSTLPDFWRRHFVDSAQLLDFAPAALAWADLGAGGGLPGVVLAILLKGRPAARVHLIESRAKPCAFLRQIVAELDLPAAVEEARAEALSLTVEVVTARACAPLERLLGYAKGFFDRGARGLFLKGETVDAEVAAARRSWRFDCALHPSRSDPRGRVLAISDLSHA